MQWDRIELNQFHLQNFIFKIVIIVREANIIVQIKYIILDKVNDSLFKKQIIIKYLQLEK